MKFLVNLLGTENFGWLIKSGLSISPPIRLQINKYSHIFFVCTFQGCLTSLQVFSVNIEYWDPIPLYMCLTKLPKLTLS